MIDHSSNGNGSSRDEVLAELVADLVAVRRGEPLDIDQVAAAHPEFADELRQLLPTMQALGEFDPTTESRRPAALDSVTAQLSGGLLGDFHLIREVGRGGMGVVFEAEQISLGRRVALKTLPLAGMLDERQLQRFRNEARAAAAFHHPNIVPVFAVGCDRGVHYYAMQFIEGQTLAQVIAAARGHKNEAGPQRSVASTEVSPSPLPVSQASHDTHPIAARSTERAPHARAQIEAIVRQGIQVAQALDYAHSLGVVHRDVKPANLLLDARGTVWLSDFGLAQLEAGSAMTMTGDLLGTLRYMSPEQALGQRGLVDHRADIYSLGITLYELLTLVPAFPETSRQKLLRQVVEQEPRPITQLNRGVPRDLETIVGKATAKEAHSRYQSARELADDLQRFLADQPIRARRPTPLARMLKWGRRHRAIFSTAAATVLLAAVCGAVFLYAAYRRETSLRTLAEQSGQVARNALLKETAQKTEADRQRRAALTNLYLADMRQGLNDWNQGNVARVRATLIRHLPASGDPDLRDWEWHYLFGLCHQAERTISHHLAPVDGVSWSPDGRHVASVSRYGGAKVWSTLDWKLTSHSRDAGDQLTHVAWSPDGQRLAACCRKTELVRIWSIANDEVITFGPQPTLCRVVWSHDGKLLASVSSYGQVQVWNAASGQCVRELPKSVVTYDASWDPTDAKLALATSALAPTLHVWDIASGEVTDTHARVGSFRSVAWSPDGRHIACGSYEGAVSLVNAENWGIERTVWEHAGAVLSMAWTRDGGRLATAADDAVIKIWSDSLDRCLHVLRGHEQGVRSVAWSPDGARLVSGSTDATVRVWNVAPQRDSVLAIETAQPDSGWGTAPPSVSSLQIYMPEIVWTGDGQSIWSARRSQAPVRASVHTNQVEQVFPLHGKTGQVSPDGQQIAFISEADGRPVIKIIAVDSGAEVTSLPTKLHTQDANISNMRVFCWSPNAHLLAIAGLRNAGERAATLLEIWHVGSRKRQLEWTGKGKIQGLAWAPDNHRLAIHGHGSAGRVLVIDAVTGEEVLKRSTGTEATAIAWTPDGRRLACANINGEIHVWEMPEGRLLRVARPFTTPIFGLAWRLGGTRMAAGGAAGIKVIDVEGGEELLTLPTTGVRTLSWSPDGDCLAALDGLGTIHHWDAGPGVAAAAAGGDLREATRLVMERGLDLAEQGEFDRAEAVFNEAGNDPSAGELRKWYMARLDCIRSPQQLVRLEPGWDKLTASLYAQRSVGQSLNANASFRDWMKAIELDPRSETGWLQTHFLARAATLHQSRQWQQLEALCQQASAAADPRLARSAKVVAHLSALTGAPSAGGTPTLSEQDRADARTMLAELNPRTAWEYKLRAKFHQTLGDQEAAEADLTQAYEPVFASPSDFALRYGLARDFDNLASRHHSALRQENRDRCQDRAHRLWLALHEEQPGNLAVTIGLARSYVSFTWHGRAAAEDNARSSVELLLPHLRHPDAQRLNVVGHLVSCYRALGEALSDLGQFEEAEANVAQADELVFASPSDFALRHHLAEDFSNLASRYHSARRQENRDRCQDRAHRLWLALHEEQPSNLQVTIGLARSHVSFAWYGRAALDNARSSVELLLPHLRHPDARRLNVAGHMVSCYCALGGALSNLGQFDEAAQTLELGFAQATDAGTYEQARVRFGQAHMLGRAGRISEAISAIESAIALHRELLENSYDTNRLSVLGITNLRGELGKDCDMIAGLLQKAMRWEESARYAREAVELRQKLVADSPDNLSLRQHLTQSQTLLSRAESELQEEHK